MFFFFFYVLLLLFLMWGMHLSMSESFACSCFMLSDLKINKYIFVGFFLRWIVKCHAQKQSREVIKRKLGITVISLSTH